MTDPTPTSRPEPLRASLVITTSPAKPASFTVHLSGPDAAGEQRVFASLNRKQLAKLIRDLKSHQVAIRNRNARWERIRRQQERRGIWPVPQDRRRATQRR
ncbi:MAG: hypothetical protein ACKVS8_11040 [Phycisphaerales bacterium]